MKKFILGALLFAASNVHATLIFNTTGLLSPESTITFDEHILSTGATVTNEYSDLGITFSPNLYYSSQTGFPNITGNTVTNFGSGNQVGSFSINFLENQTESAFAMVSNSSLWNFSALFNGAVVESFSEIVNTSTPNFYGFTGITFDEILISSSINDAMIIDNLQMGETTSVPEPTSLAILALGLVGIGFSKKKKSI